MDLKNHYYKDANLLHTDLQIYSNPNHILSPCLFNLYAEYIMRNVGLEEAQAGIMISRRNINHLRYANDTTLWQKVKRN